MIALGLALSIFGIFVALTAIMVVFMGTEGAAVPALLSPLVLGLPAVVLVAVAVLRRHRHLGGPLAALRACPGWLIAALALLMAVVLIAVLAIWLAIHFSGEPLPPRFHLPVLALAAFVLTTGLFSGLIQLKQRQDYA
ncbi:MAG: hypothetical protein EA371_05270 [Gammaproteobacteria bacterium]|nr:MAG: hypothetical protein EA371_05270 [Gammaproteobacteria bacterium]